MATLTPDLRNNASLNDACTLRDGLYEHAMLFVPRQSTGISHNLPESGTSDGMQLAAAAFDHFLNRFATELS